MLTAALVATWSPQEAPVQPVGREQSSTSTTTAIALPTTDRPLRVAFLTPNLGLGGAERQMFYLARHLPRPEFQVRFILMSGRGQLALEAEAAGIAVHVLGIDPEHCRGQSTRCFLQLARALRSYRGLTSDVDIVDAWLVPSYTFAGLAKPADQSARAHRRSTVDHRCFARTRNRLRDAAGRIAMRSVDAVVANSRAAARQAVDDEGIDASRVHVIHNAVEVPDPSERRSGVAAHQLGV